MSALRTRTHARSPIALASCLLVSLCTAACTDEAHGADALGASRLFFTASEREAKTGAEVDGPTIPTADGGADEASDSRAPTSGAPPESARSTVSPGHEPLVRRLTFQALLGSGERAQVMLDGRLCRADARSGDAVQASGAPVPLHCVAMPSGVLALQLLAEPAQLVVTTLDGRRHRLSVGGSVTLHGETPR